MKMGMYLKVAMMVFALGAVLYGIQALKSPEVQNKASDPNTMIGLLMGGDYRLFNWCPKTVAKVEILSESGAVTKTLTSSQDLSAVCELMVGSFSQEDLKNPVYQPKLRAIAQDSTQPVILERAVNTAVFRVKGMPFSCGGLLLVLGRFEKQ